MRRETEVKMFVAAYTAAEALVIWASEDVLHDIKDRSPHVGDVFYSESQHPPGRGLWVWEGTQWCNDSYDFSDYDVTYSGSWRKPTGAEMLRAARGESPFTDGAP